MCRPNDRELISSGKGWELFKNYLIAKEKFKPDYFLYENVTTMNNDIKLEIDKQLNIQPYRINSNLVSACERDRYYWTNIKNVELPKDKGILLKDILQNEDEIAEKYYYKENYTFHGWDKTICATLHINGNDIIKRVNNPEFKCHTLTAVCGGNHQKKVLIKGRVRKLTPIEYERCMTLPDGYSNIAADTHRYRWLGKFIL